MESEQKVSSLHGRVYRRAWSNPARSDSFLPAWEGVSDYVATQADYGKFSPYTGGCIAN